MTLADNFKKASHEEKIKFLLDVLQDFEGTFSTANFTSAIHDIGNAYGSLENLEGIFSYIVRDELREQSIRTARAFIGSFMFYYEQLKEQVRAIPVVGPTLVEKFFPF